MTPAKELSMWAKVNADAEAKYANRCRKCQGSRVALLDGKWRDCSACAGTGQRQGRAA